MPRKGKGVKDEFQGATHAVFVLDRSGSMSSIAKQAVDGFNEWLESMVGFKRVTVDAYMFDTAGSDPTVQTIFRGHTPESAPRLFDAQKTLDTTSGKLPFIPRGSTPMYDAVGQVLSETPIPGKSDRLLVAILTDGYENASRDWTQDAVKKIVQEREATGRVTIAWMIGNEDTVGAQRVAASMGSTTPGTSQGFQTTMRGAAVASGQTIGSTQSYMSSAAPASPDFYGTQKEAEKPLTVGKDETLEEQWKKRKKAKK